MDGEAFRMGGRVSLVGVEQADRDAVGGLPGVDGGHHARGHREVSVGVVVDHDGVADA